jgi:GDP-D-mannose 3', 5'-epimerase
VYALAADMGGMGFISANHATILHNNALINLHTIEAARLEGVSRYLYTSSACIYPEYLQLDADVKPLREEDAYPADPQDAYGWEKLITEKLVRVLRVDYHGMECASSASTTSTGPTAPTTEAARRPRPPSAGRSRRRRGRRDRSRSGATASRPGRSATSTTASRASTGSCMSDTPSRSTSGPTHGHDQRAGQDHHRDLGERDIGLEHVPGPQGVRGRNSDNTRLREVLGWEPGIDLEEGLEPTYRWIEKQVAAG